MFPILTQEANVLKSRANMTELMIGNSSRVGSLLCGFGPTQFKKKLIPHLITAKMTGF